MPTVPCFPVWSRRESTLISMCRSDPPARMRQLPSGRWLEIKRFFAICLSPEIRSLPLGPCALLLPVPSVATLADSGWLLNVLEGKMGTERLDST